MGRTPKPTKLKTVAGVQCATPSPPIERPPAPAHLDEIARLEWDRISQLLVDANLLTQLDQTALSMYCVVYSRWIWAEYKISTEGVVMPVGNNQYPVQSPYLNISNMCIKQLTTMLKEFGFSPSARQKMIAEKMTTPGKELIDFLNLRTNGKAKNSTK